MDETQKKNLQSLCRLDQEEASVNEFLDNPAVLYQLFLVTMMPVEKLKDQDSIPLQAIQKIARVRIMQEVHGVLKSHESNQ